MTASMETGGPDEFVVERSDSGSEVLLQLAGELDLAGVHLLEQAATNLPPSAHVTVDLSHLQFTDSSGIRALMNLDLRSRDEAWTLTLRAPQAQVLYVLKLCGFENRFEIT